MAHGLGNFDIPNIDLPDFEVSPEVQPIVDEALQAMAQQDPTQQEVDPGTEDAGAPRKIGEIIQDLDKRLVVALVAAVIAAVVLVVAFMRGDKNPGDGE